LYCSEEAEVAERPAAAQVADAEDAARVGELARKLLGRPREVFRGVKRLEGYARDGRGLAAVLPNSARFDLLPPGLLGVACPYFHFRSIIGSRPEDLFRSAIWRAVLHPTLAERLVLFLRPVGRS